MGSSWRQVCTSRLGQSAYVCEHCQIRLGTCTLAIMSKPRKMMRTTEALVRTWCSYTSASQTSGLRSKDSPTSSSSTLASAFARPMQNNYHVRCTAAPEILLDSTYAWCHSAYACCSALPSRSARTCSAAYALQSRDSLAAADSAGRQQLRPGSLAPDRLSHGSYTRFARTGDRPYLHALSAPVGPQVR